MTKAPTPSAKLMPWVAAMRAAPGVDQARTTGIFACQERRAEPTALPRLMARSQLAVCSGVAPSAVAAASRIATEAA